VSLLASCCPGQPYKSVNEGFTFGSATAGHPFSSYDHWKALCIPGFQLCDSFILPQLVAQLRNNINWFSIQLTKVSALQANLSAFSL
jgi:hypothetical protein